MLVLQRFVTKVVINTTFLKIFTVLFYITVTYKNWFPGEPDNSEYSKCGQVL